MVRITAQWSRNPMLIAGIMSLTMVACTAPDQDAIRIGTSSIGSNYYTLAVAASELIHEYAQINSAVQAVGGSMPNIFALGNKKIDFAIANSFAAYSGFHGLNEFSKPIDLRIVMQGQITHRHFVVRKGSGITSPEDFVGRTIIGERPSNPDMRMIMDRLVSVYNLPKDKINIVSTTNSSEALKALRVGSVDAAIFPFSNRNALVEQALNDEIVEFLYIPTDKRDKILEGLPATIHGSTIKRDTFLKQEKDYPTFSINTLLVVRADLAKDIVYKVAAALFDHNQELSAYIGNAAEWTAKGTLRNSSLPFHDGAIRYFQETGLWTTELERNQIILLNTLSEK